VRISLDYYRILGVTNRATAEQIVQAHSDRLLSMPRKEFSEAAIASRRRLLDSAHAILSDPINRQTYDYQITVKPGKATEGVTKAPSRAATMEVDDREITGVLLILQELGDHDQVLSLSRAYLQMNEISPRLDWSKYDPDVLLANAIAYAETGREERRQGRYELAAQSLEVASNMLLQAGTFLSLRSEIQTDLLKLCPYRILELLAGSGSTESDRQKGISLLKQMLDARRGIDGKGDDYSGLNSGDFVQFIQRLRPHMSVAEQQELFELESKRPSTIAAYLAVYALIGGGFSQRQPAMIRRAKGLLVKLSSSQDVYIEQAICALLLGQTEEASRALERSSEKTEIEIIRQASEGAPDLLPGLCPYSERWIQSYVYPYFRDLADLAASLSQYFADPEVQDYIDSLPQMGSGTDTSQWTESALPAYSSLNLEPKETRELAKEASIQPPIITSSRQEPEVPRFKPGNVPSKPQTGQSREQPIRMSKEIKSKPPIPTLDRKTIKSKARSPLHLDRLLLVLAIIFALLSGLSALAVWAWRSLAETPIALETPLIAPIVAPITLAKVTPLIPTTSEINQEIANKVVTDWQTVKAKALGNSHEIELLDTVLAEPILSNWRSRAKDLKSSDSYLEYALKSMEAKSFKPDGKDKGILRVKIAESRNLYEKGNLSKSGSNPDSKYEVSYTVVRKDDKLLIQDMLVHD
jgi:hypothetical protein